MITVVIPTIREDCAKRWVREWGPDLDGVRVIVVEDNPTRTFDITGVEHYAWEDVDRDLGDDSWVIPRRSSACRSYGFLKALEGDCKAIWTLDDDCYPEDGNRGGYIGFLEENFRQPVRAAEVHNGWWNTIAGSGMYPRGYPYAIRDVPREIAVHHGLWSNHPDFDGVTQLANPDFRLPPAELTNVVPENAFFPMCIMNVAFRREMTPAMYMLLMGQDRDGGRWGFDRFDDIWAGLFMKRIADHLGFAVTSGYPGVHHSKASDPNRNAVLEAPGMEAHEAFWMHIAQVDLTGTTVGECYDELAVAVKGSFAPAPEGRSDYWVKLGDAMLLWNRLVEERQ